MFALDKAERAGDPAANTDAAAGSAQPTTADQFARRGAASASRRDYASALADLDRACELDPTSAPYLVQRGLVREALKQPVKAREDFDRALAIDPAENDARLQRAALRIEAKDGDGANADLDVLAGTVAPQSQMRLALANLYLRLERPAEALAQFDLWLPAHPNEVRRDVAQNGRCRARLQLGRELDRALDDCDDAVGGDARNAAYLDSRGWVNLRLGKDGKAIADFDRSIEAQPRNARSFYGRGLAKKHLGDQAQGDADLMAARKLQPDIDARLTRIHLIGESTTNQ